MVAKTQKKHERAQRRIKNLKGFYRHAVVFVLFNGALFLFRNAIMAAILGEEALKNPKVTSWVYESFYVWGIILLIHGILVFVKKPYFVKKWEERQMAKFIQEAKTEDKITNIEK